MAGIIGGLFGGSIVVITMMQSPPLPTPEPAVIERSVQPITVDISTAITNAVDRVSPAVVKVVSYYPGEAIIRGTTVESFGTGSGFIISMEGYIVTNNHVVDGAERVEVVLYNGTTLKAEIVGAEPYADLAVLLVQGNLPAIAEWGNSDFLKTGETVLAIGSPLGDFTNTVTAGVVSATDRTLEISQEYFLEGLIQTDAAINQGNSGGPLINLDGQVVGINTFIVRGNGQGSAVAEGLGFAVPSTFSSEVANQLIQKGFFSRPYMGVRWIWITPDLASRYGVPLDQGVLISDVLPGGPADVAGIRKGDIITRIMGQTIDAENPFRNLIFQYDPGEPVRFELYRNGETTEAELILTEMPPT